MKTLKQYADDLRATAELLRETADGLEKMNEEQAHAVMAAMGIQIPAPGRRPPAAKKSPPPAPVKHELSAEDKAALRKEYFELPPEKRTREMRTALALKWQVTPVQFNLITLSDEEKARRVRLRAAKADRTVAKHLHIAN